MRLLYQCQRLHSHLVSSCLGGNLRALAYSPCDWVQDPKQSSQTSAVQEGPFDVTAERLGVDARCPHKLVDNVEESDAACSLLDIIHREVV
jgi:hypothetical protein